MLITFLYQLFTGKFGDFCRSRQNVRTGLVAKIWASLAIVVLKVVASCALAVDHGGWWDSSTGLEETMDFEKVEMFNVISILYKSFVNLDELRCCYKWSHRICFDEEIPMRPLFGTDAWTPGLLDSWTFMEIDRFRLPFSAKGLRVFSLTIFAKETIGVVLMLIPVSTFNKISNFHTSSHFFPYLKESCFRLASFFFI